MVIPTIYAAAAKRPRRDERGLAPVIGRFKTKALRRLPDYIEPPVTGACREDLLDLVSVLCAERCLELVFC